MKKKLFTPLIIFFLFPIYVFAITESGSNGLNLGSMLKSYVEEQKRLNDIGSAAKNINPTYLDSFFNQFFGKDKVPKPAFNSKQTTSVGEEMSKPKNSPGSQAPSEQLQNSQPSASIDPKTIQASIDKDLKQSSNKQECRSGNYIEGDSKNMLGCGLASTFGHNTDGTQDKYLHAGGGDTFCRNNRQGDKQYVFKSNRPTKKNLETCVVALKRKDIAKLFSLENDSYRTLGKERKKYCGKMIKITDTATKKSVDVALYDIMGNGPNAVIDLTGCVAKELFGVGQKAPKKPVRIEWSDKPTPPEYKY